MSTTKKIALIIILLIGVFVLYLILSKFVFNRSKPEEITQTTELDKYVYYNFHFPSELSGEEVNDSLLGSNSINKNGVENNWLSWIEQKNKAAGWQLLNTAQYSDGGSKREYYFLNKNNPAVEMFYQWDMTQGKFTNMDVKFIHLSRLCSWLAKIRNEKVMIGGNLDIQKLADCSN